MDKVDLSVADRSTLTGSSRKTPYVRFDLNDYSIPHGHVKKSLTVVATLTEVKVIDGENIIAKHPRCNGKLEQIEDENHIKKLQIHKKQARCHRGQDRLANAVPSSKELLNQAAQRGTALSSIVNQLIQQLDDYGAQELEIAITEALHQNVPHPNAVHQVLERRREQKQLPSPIAIALLNNPQARNLVVRSASLADYDELNTEKGE